VAEDSSFPHGSHEEGILELRLNSRSPEQDCRIIAITKDCKCFLLLLYEIFMLLILLRIRVKLWCNPWVKEENIRRSKKDWLPKNRPSALPSCNRLGIAVKCFAENLAVATFSSPKSHQSAKMAWF
jgi:hypothetical protein